MIRNLRSLFLFLFLILGVFQVRAQQYVFTDITATGNAIPFAGTTNMRQYIYYPSNFPTAPAGNITALYIKASAATSVSFANLTIKMGHTSLSTFTAGPYATGLTTVYTGPFSGTTIAGNWVVVTLQAPFAYNGSQNFIIEASQTGYAPGFTVIQATANVAARSLYGTIATSSGTQDRLAHLGFDLVLAGPPCAGPPTAGNITGPNVACTGGPVNLLLNNYTSAQGISIQWESSPAGGSNWLPIPNATFASLSTTQTVATDYRAVVTCINGNFTDITGVHTVAMGQFFNCYCSPLTGTVLHSANGNYITGVSIAGTTLAASTATVGTGGYTQMDPSIPTNTANLTQLVPYTIDVQVGAGTYNAGAWIDYDMSGTFTASEYIQLTTSGTNATGTILIPGTSLTGQTGMRIRAYTTGPYGSGGACTNITTGFETEDYVIDINPGTPCSGTPASGGTITSASSATICPGGSAALSLSGFTSAIGITLQWEEAPAGSALWSPIAGANSYTYATPALANSMDYRVLVTCTNSNAFTYSAVYTVNINNPQIIETYPGSRCGSGPVTLLARANTGSTVKWYTAQTGGTAVGTGNAYTTPTISNSTTYYAAAAGAGGGTQSVGPLTPQIVGAGGGTAAAITTYHVAFDVLSPTTLISVDIFPTAAIGTSGAIAIQNSASATLITVPYTTTVTGGATAQTIPINLPLQPGTGYKMGQSTAIALFRNTTGAVYPYTSSAINIISNNFNPVYYYYFYNWQYSSGCESARVPVAATINSSPSGSGLSTGGTTTGSLHADGATVDYMDACLDKVATVTDAVGGNVLGATSAVVLTSPAVKTFNGIAPYVPRVFDITPASSGAATVTLYVLQSEFNAYNSYVTSNSLGSPLLPTSPTDVLGMANIVITQFHGNALAGTTGPFGLYDVTNASFIPNASITKSSNGTYWSLTFPVTGFSGFFVHTGSTPLAIDLKSISATNVGDRNRVDWTTSKELADDRFEIEKSADGKSFTRLGNVNAKGQASSYSYWDEQPFAGVNYYRLKMLHTSGNGTYSQVVNATMRGAGAFGLEAFPNPVSDMLTVKVYGKAATSGVITVHDVTGKILRAIAVTNNEGVINMAGMAQGSYMIRYTDAGNSGTIKVNKL